ncbi:DUF6438 domain-containing protein [Erythrobacter alti]|uniref:DUF6438 domain-containing protein n=1 Tax=Erythrobacter alti TaxID=1896145 RepID=UPI0030F47BA5
MKLIPTAGIMALSLGACVQTGEVTEPTVERISFAVEPCFGFCPDFNLTLDASGEGVFEGENFVAKRGTRNFSASAAEFTAFRERLAPFRPVQSVSYGYDNCDGAVATDMPSVRVTWHDSDGTSTRLDWYMGCFQPGLHDRSDEIYRAWEELPISELVGADEDRASFRPS